MSSQSISLFLFVELMVSFPSLIYREKSYNFHFFFLFFYDFFIFFCVLLGLIKALDLIQLVK